MAITNPDANTIRLTNESGADFQDIVDSGVAGITKTGTATYVITRALSLVNSTLSDTNKIIRFEWGAITTPLLIDDDSELQLGELDGDGYGINGCQVFMNSSYSGSSTINLGGPPSGDNTGNIKFYGCHIKGISPNTTGTGINATYFWRLYDDSTAQVNDIRDCQIEFNGGGRFHGTNSKLVRNKFINCKTAVSPFTTRSPFGEISNNQVFACSASYYWYPLQSGSLTVTNAFGRDNDYAAIVSSTSSDTNQTLTFVDADFDTFTFSWIGAGGTNLRVREDYNYVPTVLDQATQTAITSGRIYIENLAETQVHNEALDGSGQVGELILRAGQYRKATGNTRTDETPHTIKVRCYGYLFQEFPVDIDARTVTNLSQIENNFVVANESTAGSYTGITVNGSAETITVSSNHTLQEVYDYCNWWAAQSANMQYDMPISTADGSTFTLAAGWSMTVTGAGVEVSSPTLTLADKDNDLTVASGAYFRDSAGAIWEDSGSVYYASYITYTCLDGVTPIENVELYHYDSSGNNRTYNTSLTLVDSLTSNGSGIITGYAVYKIDGDTDGAHTVKARQYGYDTYSAPKTVSGTTITADVNMSTDDYAGDTESNVASYTGISLNYTTKQVTVTEDHTIQEVYDYIKYSDALQANLDEDDTIDTSDGSTFMFDADWDLIVTGAGVELIEEDKHITYTGIGAITVASGAFFEDSNGVTWEASGDLYYASHGYLQVKDASTDDPIEDAVVGWGDCDESQCLLYDTSLVETAVETDASGEVEGYLVYKINSTTYGNTKQLTGEYNYGFSTIPRSISGSAIGSSVSPEIIRLSSDDEVTLSKANAALISDITVDASNDIIDLSDEDLSDAYDNLKYQVASTEDIYTNIPGVMYYGLYGSPLRKSGTSYTARTDTTTYEQLACNGYTFNNGIIDWDAPTTCEGNYSGVDFNFSVSGEYDFRGASIAGVSNELTNSSGGNVLLKLAPGVSYLNTGPSITIEESIAVTIANANLADGTRIRLYNVTQDAEIDNDVVSGGSGYSYVATVGIGEEIEIGDVVTLYATYASGSSYKENYSETATITSVDVSFSGTQTDWDDANDLSVDGSAVTEFSADYPNVQVDVDSVDLEFKVSELVAWLIYIQTTEDGIRNFYGAISSKDTANWEINTDVVDLMLDNINVATVTQEDTVILMRDDLVYPQVRPTSGGGGIGMVQSGNVFVVETGVSGLTPAESAKLDLISTVDSNVDKINSFKYIPWLVKM